MLRSAEARVVSHPFITMKTLRCIAAVFALTLMSFIVSRAAEEKPIAGSIQPQGEVKPANLPDLAKISFDAALKIARTTAPGSVIKAELEVERGTLMYSFQIVGKDKTITEIEIDAGNGKVLQTEKEENEAEDQKPSVEKKHP